MKFLNFPFQTINEKVNYLLLQVNLKEIEHAKMECENHLKRKDSELESITKLLEEEKTEIQEKYEDKVRNISYKIYQMGNRMGIN